MLAAPDSLGARNQSLVMVEGHSGEEHNETADYFAKIATHLPAQPAIKSTGPWDLVVLGERVPPPHEVWTRRQTPTHRHERFHPLSFVPLRWNRVVWHKWIFVLQQRIGLQHYATFWRDDPPKQECTSCGNRHNSSVHGYLAYCHDTHPLVQSWYSAWPSPGILRAWRQSAHCKERRIPARLCIPMSLYAHLRHRLGFVTARASIKLFQRKVVDNVTLALETITGGTHPTSCRPDPYSIADWRENSAWRPVPDTLKWDNLCCFRSVACVPCPLALHSIAQCQREIETRDGEMLTKPAKLSKAPFEGKGRGRLRSCTHQLV